MQPDSQSNISRAGPIIGRVAAKEITLFFASPIAYVFLGSFAVITLFVFFWVEAFFSAISPTCARCLSGCRFC